MAKEHHLLLFKNKRYKETRQHSKSRQYFPTKFPEKVKFYLKKNTYSFKFQICYQQIKWKKNILKKGKKEIALPHTTAILEGIRSTLKGPIEMAMNLMLPFTALIQKRKSKQCSDIGTFASQSNENGDVSRIIFGVFTVRVKVNGPLVAAHREIVAGNVLPYAHPFG